MASKSRNANFSQEEKLLLAELGKQYPDIENKGYVRLKRKQSLWEKVVQSFNAGNPDENNSWLLEGHETANEKRI